MKKLLMHAWWLEKDDDGYYLPATHYVYLIEIVKYYSEICLMAPVLRLPAGTKSTLSPIAGFSQITVHELPGSQSYLSAIKHFSAYLDAYKKLHTLYDRVYVRYPTPFGWLSKYYFKDIIIHFVGDPIDAARSNPTFSPLKKKLFINLFRPEHYMFLQACKKARVFTNGYHIQQRLNKQGIKAQAVISSTLSASDFHLDADKTIDPANVKLLYIGYLRKAKGVETLIQAVGIFRKNHPGVTFTIAGIGEFEEGLKALANTLNLNDVIRFIGHVNERSAVNELYRTHDVFCFASLSEGSPRVILEAMANGINVVSTPVGALPNIFEHDKDIVFAEAGNPQDFADKISALISNSADALYLKTVAHHKAKNYTTANFIKTIFQ